MAVLTGSAQPVTLGAGYALRAPGILGQAELKTPRPAGVRARSRAPEDGTEALEKALRSTNVTEVRQVDLQLQNPPAGASTRALRSPDGQEALELSVPDLGPDTGQIVLACDESGVLTWHLPVEHEGPADSATRGGAGAQKHFVIPATRVRPAAPADTSNRGVIGVLGRKLLKVLIYPILDPVIGAMSEHFAEVWETKRRPYGLRDFSPGNFRSADVGALAAGDWERLAGKRALLFIHGTFSTAHASFGLLSDETFTELFKRYEGRVLAFNHFTLAHDPDRNVGWLLANLPRDVPLEVDIICHSRGGLVARTLTERPSAFGLDTAGIKVGRVVFVGVPNAGTPLADPDHMVKMIDRFTTALNLFPSGPITETLEALITAVKVIGHGALQGLDGLACMRPAGAFLKTLNHGEPAGAEYYAVAADFEPTDSGLKALLAGTVADAVIDRVFENVPNDMVVPEPGVYGENGCKTFPIAGVNRMLQIPPGAGVVHTTLFGSDLVRAKLLDWLL
jgi:hypothetical protein